MVFGTQTSEKSIYIVQRKIAFLTFAAGFLVSVINFFSLIDEFTMTEAVSNPAVFFLSAVSVAVLLTGLKNHILFRILQIILATLVGFVAIMDVYNSIHGLGLIMMAFFLAFKYGFLKKRFSLKILITIIVVFAMVMLSAQLDNRGSGIMHGLDAIIYLTVIVMVTYFIYQDEIIAYIKKNREAEGEIAALQSEHAELALRLAELDKRIAVLAEPVDLAEMGLTKKELEVLEALILYRETEHQLAERLGMSFHTLKNHFRHIRDKLGVDKREDIIEMCRNNFS